MVFFPLLGTWKDREISSVWMNLALTGEGWPKFGVIPGKRTSHNHLIISVQVITVIWGKLENKFFLVYTQYAAKNTWRYIVKLVKDLIII
jgi:hypothetical protein